MLEEKLKKKIYGKIEACQESLKYTMEDICCLQSSLYTISYLMFLLDSDNKQE